MTTVRAFRSVHEVSTFRLAKLSGEHYRLKHDIETKHAKMREKAKLGLQHACECMVLVVAIVFLLAVDDDGVVVCCRNNSLSLRPIEM